MKAAKTRLAIVHLARLMAIGWVAVLIMTLIGKAKAGTEAGAISSKAVQEPLPSLLIPIGGGYSEVYAGVTQAVIERTSGNTASILVLPIAFASNPTTITSTEHDEELDAAEERRQQIEEACQQVAPPGVTCTAALAPVFTRHDAETLDLPSYFKPDLTAIFILGGDQTIAMQVIAGTMLEKELESAYQHGILIAGTSAGAGLLSATMIGGYNPGFDIQNSLNFGAADVWVPPTRHGLLFGLQSAMIEQHFYERNRVGRLLNAISLPNVPHIGVGLDSSTGCRIIENTKLERVFGLYTVTILDADTYHAASGVEYIGKNNTLSLHNVLVHLLAPGQFSYDFKSHQHSLEAPPKQVEREFKSLVLPPGAGSLFLGGDLSSNLQGNPVLTRFINDSGGEQANILIVAAGFPTSGTAQTQAERYKNALGVQSQILILPMEAVQPPPIPSNFTGVILTAKDQSRLNPQLLVAVRDAWHSGVPVFADDAASAVVGAFYAPHPPTPDVEQLAMGLTQESFLAGKIQLKPGLGLLNIVIEPQLMNNNRWGRLFSLAYNHPDLLAIGLNVNTTLSVTKQGASVEGENPMILLDLRQARLALGENQGFVIANGLLDVFAPGNIILPEVADIQAAPIPAATPSLNRTKIPSLTPETPATRVAPKIPAIKTPPPTKTPLLIPTPISSTPPPNPALLHGMVTLGVAAVVIVLLGYWITIRRFKRRGTRENHNHSEGG
jgi:cyanophycinase